MESRTDQGAVPAMPWAPTGEAARWRKRLLEDQLHVVAPVTLATPGRPVALTVTVLCRLPIVGVARQSVRLAEVAPTPVG